MLSDLYIYILDHEDWLMDRILDYALKRGYTRYTSTLKEAWRLSISGLSESLIRALKSSGGDLELGPEENYLEDPSVQFGITEAILHRERGVSLDMFLGLMKYYRQSYSDLIRESTFKKADKIIYEQQIKRFFDRVEIGFCLNWSSSKDETFVNELQSRNRTMTNEKNKYLTIFESLSIPIFIVDTHGYIENMNHVASLLLDESKVPGSQYYRKKKQQLRFLDIFPWLRDMYSSFVSSDESKVSFENKSIREKANYFFISFSKSLDISGKFSGTIVMMENITERKILEKELELLATTDPLTGALNRRAFLMQLEKEITRARRYDHILALMMMDIDHFKKINDRHGHTVGDSVLRLLVSESCKMLRQTDVFGRWGGEEFILLLPETNLEQALQAAERLRLRMAELSLITDEKKSVSFTVSIGLVLVGREAFSVDIILKTVDDALYQAKKKGRNRVVLASE